MTFSYYITHHNPLFSPHKILKLNDVANSQISKFNYFFSNRNLPKELDNFFSKTVSGNPYNTRSEEQFHI